MTNRRTEIKILLAELQGEGKGGDSVTYIMYFSLQGIDNIKLVNFKKLVV